jgi:hypothetical protein
MRHDADVSCDLTFKAVRGIDGRRSAPDARPFY